MTNKLQAILACFSLVFSVAVYLVSDDVAWFVAAFWAFNALLIHLSWERRDWEFIARGWRDLYYKLKVRELRKDEFDGENWKQGGSN